MNYMVVMMYITTNENVGEQEKYNGTSSYLLKVGARHPSAGSGQVPCPYGFYVLRQHLANFAHLSYYNFASILSWATGEEDNQERVLPS